MKTLWKRWKMFVLCLVAGQSAATPGVQAAEDTGLLGTKLAAVEKTHDFFTFFNLERTGSEPGPDRRTVVSYKPTGAAFRPLVTLLVTTDEHGTIERLRLEVARSFIDDRRQGIFAADIVKSFLFSPGGGAKDEIAALANEIHARSMMNSGTTVFTARPAPTVSGTPSAGYQTYAGKTPKQTVANRTGSVEATLQNKPDTLEIDLARVVW